MWVAEVVCALAVLPSWPTSFGRHWLLKASRNDVLEMSHCLLKEADVFFAINVPHWDCQEQGNPNFQALLTKAEIGQVWHPVKPGTLTRNTQAPYHHRCLLCAASLATQWYIITVLFHGHCAAQHGAILPP